MLLSLKNTATLREGAEAEAGRGPRSGPVALEGVRRTVQGQAGAGWTVPAGRGPSGDSSRAGWGPRVVGSASDKEELSTQSLSGDGIDRKEEGGWGWGNNLHTNTTASELAP